MANRSYLYASDFIPGQPDGQGRKLVGLSEWRYDIPLVFKLLASGRPQLCPSLIGGDHGDIAIVGDYAAGLSALEAFLARLQYPPAQRLVNEALEFLHAPEQRARYLVLEPGELFAMTDAPAAAQGQALLTELQDLAPSVEEALSSLAALLQAPASAASDASQARAPWWARWFSRPSAPPPPAPADPLAPFRALGLGHWSGELYFDPEGQ